MDDRLPDVQDADVVALAASVRTPFNLEMACTEEMVAIARRVLEEATSVAEAIELVMWLIARGAMADLADRYAAAPDRLAGVIVVSDGGDTAPLEARPPRALDAPVIAVGIGRPDVGRDREVLNLTAGEPLMPGSAIDISVAATAAGFGTDPIELRLSANGRALETRRISPSSDGAPVHAVFTVSPPTDASTVYTVQIPGAGGEITTENNTRSVLVPNPSTSNPSRSSWSWRASNACWPEAEASIRSGTNSRCDSRRPRVSRSITRSNSTRSWATC